MGQLTEKELEILRRAIFKYAAGGEAAEVDILVDLHKQVTASEKLGIFAMCQDCNQWIMEPEGCLATVCPTGQRNMSDLWEKQNKGRVKE